jgi:hypothetical protein
MTPADKMSFATPAMTVTECLVIMKDNNIRHLPGEYQGGGGGGGGGGAGGGAGGRGGGGGGGRGGGGGSGGGGRGAGGRGGGGAPPRDHSCAPF